MNFSQHATKGHLIVGVVLILCSLGSFIANQFFPGNIISFLIFFFGVWGGVELGRYLEFYLQNQSEHQDVSS